MKYTVDGTRYTTIREGAQVKVEADDERQAAERAQELGTSSTARIAPPTS